MICYFQLLIDRDVNIVADLLGTWNVDFCLTIFAFFRDFSVWCICLDFSLVGSLRDVAWVEKLLLMRSWWLKTEYDLVNDASVWTDSKWFQISVGLCVKMIALIIVTGILYRALYISELLAYTILAVHYTWLIELWSKLGLMNFIA